MRFKFLFNHFIFSPCFSLFINDHRIMIINKRVHFPRCVHGLVINKDLHRTLYSRNIYVNSPVILYKVQ